MTPIARLPLLVLVGLLTACQRAPEEPVPIHRESLPDPAPKPAGNASSKPDHPLPAPIASVPTPVATCPPDPDKGGPKIPTYTLSVTEQKLAIEAEFVSTPKDSERGLMYRTTMAENHGMLFKLPKKEQIFWMHNTCIPLDMLFLEADGKIVGLLENVPILNDEPRSAGVESVYVLEMNAGYAKAHGVHVGQHIALPEPVKKLVVK